MRIRSRMLFWSCFVLLLPAMYAASFAPLAFLDNRTRILKTGVPYRVAKAYAAPIRAAGEHGPDWLREPVRGYIIWLQKI